MVKYTKQLSRTFSALSDPTRRLILEQLLHKDKTVSGLAEPFKISAPAITKHLRVLEQAGLISRKKEGRSIICHVEPKPINEARDWIGKYKKFWSERLETLDTYLKNTS